MANRHLPLYLAIPAVTILLVFTNQFHGLIWQETTFSAVGRFTTLRVEHGFWFWVISVYSYMLMLLGAAVMLFAYIRSASVFRKQAVWVIAGMLFSLGFNAAYIFDVIPGLIKDYTPIAFAASALFFYVGIFRFRLLDLVPVARSTVFTQMRDGIVVLDEENRILDLNPAAVTALGCGKIQPGMSTSDLPPACPDIQAALNNPDTIQQIAQIVDNEERYYDVEVSPLQRGGRIRGHLVHFHDVTEQTRLIRRIETIARTDGLTSLYNRRHFVSLANSELRRSLRFEKPMALALLDLDHFKRVNDEHGHPAGDAVLTEAARRIEQSIRVHDIVGRFGGEEFAVLLPETDHEGARQVCERIRTTVGEKRYEVDAAVDTNDKSHISVTTSVGVAFMSGGTPVDLDTLIKRADDSLYAAKQSGRNRVVVWRETDKP